MPACAKVESLFVQGNEYLKAEQYAQAAASFRQAILLAPDIAELHANLGLALEHLQQPAEAETCYRHALTLDAGLSEVHRNLGVLLASQKRFAEAEQAYQQALALNPDSAVTWSNLGVLHACQRQEQLAENCYQRALNIDPAYRLARFNLSYLQLHQGRFEEGWASLEARDWYRQLQALLPFPRWQGEALQGKHILIGIEAGHGDMIHFCRYASLLRDRGAARIGILCHPALAPLLATHAALDVIAPIGAVLPDTGWDYWVPPMSLPFHCQTRLDSIPARLPYLHALPQRIACWQSRIPQQGLRVGLVWRGNPRHENDADRSLPSLATFAALGEIAGVHFVSLQKGPGEEDALLTSTGLPLVPLGHTIKDFADTAAIVAQLDLVISVDSAVAHLAGALNTPCWIMLPAYKTDWRWLTERCDSPWYPDSVRLYRQKQPGNWREVVNRIRDDLSCLAALPARALPDRPAHMQTP